MAGLLTGIAGLIVIAMAVWASAYLKGKKERDREKVDIATVFPEYPKLHVECGYYMSDAKQYEETKDHVSFHWYAFNYDVDQFIREMQESKLKIVLDYSSRIFDSRFDAKLDKVIITKKADPYTLLWEALDKFQAAGILGQVKWLYPMDEPNLYFENDDEVNWAIDIGLEIRAKYAEVSQAKLLCCYMTKGKKFGIKRMDVVGIDDYPYKSEIFLPGKQYEQMREEMTPFQTTALFAGVDHLQKPKPFVDIALTYPEVDMLVGFVWFDQMDGRAFNGARVNGQADAWRQAFLTVLRRI